MSKTAGIVVIGNEILSGRTRDENTDYFLRELRDLGIDVRKVSIIPDDLDSIREEVRSFSGCYDYVFTSGGVGPTHDDVTIKGIASAFKRGVYRHHELEAMLRGYYQESVTEATLRMADVPEGAFLLRRGKMWFPVVAVENVYIFPGVPEILAAKFERIKEMFRQDPYFVMEIYLKEDEGLIADILYQFVDRFPELLLGSYPTFDNPDYMVKLTLESKDQSYLDTAHQSLIDSLSAQSISPLRV